MAKFTGLIICMHSSKVVYLRMMCKRYYEQRASTKVVHTLVFVLSLFDRLLNWLECLAAPRGNVICTWKTHCPKHGSILCLQPDLFHKRLFKKFDLLCVCEQCSESNERSVHEAPFQYYFSQFPGDVKCVRCHYC